MICGSIFSRRRARGTWRAARWIFPTFLLAACPSFCPDGPVQAPPEAPSTGDFLDPDDFNGAYDKPVSDTAFSGQSTYDGRLVFANLPRTVVDDVLPSDLHLATNLNPTYQDVHPIILLYGDQLNGLWEFSWGTMPLGVSYNELIILIPFVQREGGSKWHNYVVRMYLDNDDAILVGNLYYGYFKQKAAFLDNSTTLGSLTLSFVDVSQSSKTVFKWTAQTPSGSFLPSATALATLPNYQDAIEIMSMPLLGTLTVFGTSYICSYWDWNLQNADVRPTKVASEFVQPPRSGTTSWVSQGSIASTEDFAFELRGLVWQMAFPALPCSF